MRAPIGAPVRHALSTVRVIGVLAPLEYPQSSPLGTPWVSPRRPTARDAGTLDQQKATIERVSKEIGALADLVEANEAKGRLGQVRVGAPDYVLTGYSSLLTWHSRGTLGVL